MTWDSLYELQPADTTVIADTDDVIRGLKAAIRERFAREHQFDLTDSDEQGRHLPGSAKAWYQSAAPTYRQPVGDLVALGTDDAGQIWVDSDDKLMQVWDGSAFQGIKVANAVAAVSATSATSANSALSASTANALAGTGSGSPDAYFTDISIPANRRYILANPATGSITIGSTSISALTLTGSQFAFYTSL